MISALAITSFLILIFSIILHEIAHGWVALKLGDSTAKRAGRLTLNPVPHIDLWGSIILPAFFIISGSPVMLGWAKPVPVRPQYFSNYRWGTVLVSAAGVFTNFVLGLLAALSLRFLVGSHEALDHVLFGAAMINFGLAVFNLLPIPPLDGFTLFAALFNKAEEADAFVAKIGPFGFLMLFLALWVLPIGSVVYWAASGLFLLIVN